MSRTWILSPVLFFFLSTRTGNTVHWESIVVVLLVILVFFEFKKYCSRLTDYVCMWCNIHQTHRVQHYRIMIKCYIFKSSSVISLHKFTDVHRHKPRECESFESCHGFAWSCTLQRHSSSCRHMFDSWHALWYQYHSRFISCSQSFQLQTPHALHNAVLSILITIIKWQSCQDTFTKAVIESQAFHAQVWMAPSDDRAWAVIVPRWMLK